LNGKGNGVNRKGRQERKERPAFFSKNQPWPLGVYPPGRAFFAVRVFAVAVAFHSAFRIPHLALG
jgi:hypothetical protein